MSWLFGGDALYRYKGGAIWDSKGNVFDRNHKIIGKPKSYEEFVNLVESQGGQRATTEAQQRFKDMFPNLESESESTSTARSKGALKDFRSTTDKFASRERGRGKRLDKAYGQFADDYSRFIAQDRADWESYRDKAERAWRDPKWEEDYRKSREISEGTLATWQSILDKEQPFLRGIRDQQLGLANELRDAPSTVEEQARIEADRALQAEVAMAGAFGGSLASNFASFSNQAMTRRGDVLRDTSALRAQEYANRINQRAGILGQAGGTSIDIANLGVSDANIRAKVAEDIYRRKTIEQGGEAQFLANLGLQSVNVGTTLQNRASGILGGLDGVLGYQRAGDRLSIGDEASLFAMTSGLEDREYDRFVNERAYKDMKDREADQRRSGLFKSIATVGGSIIGGAFGGPPGAMIGGGIGGGIGSLFGGGGGGALPFMNQAGGSGSFTSAGGYNFGAGMPEYVGRPRFNNTFSKPAQPQGNVGIGEMIFSGG